MYEDLINRLRYESQNAIETCDFDFALAWMQEAADAIEELSKELLELKLLTCCCGEPPEE